MSLDQGRSHDELAFLRGIDLFLTLEPDEMITLRQGVFVRQVEAGEAIIRQGDFGDSLFVVKSGRLLATMQLPGGSEIEVGKLEPGQVFGEMSMMTGSPRSATVKSGENCIVVEINKSAMDLLLSKDAGLAERISLLINDRTTANEATLGRAAVS